MDLERECGYLNYFRIYNDTQPRSITPGFPKSCSEHFPNKPNNSKNVQFHAKNYLLMPARRLPRRPTQNKRERWHVQMVLVEEIAN